MDITTEIQNVTKTETALIINKESQDKLAEIRNSGTFCCLEIQSDYNYVWNINLIKARSKSHKPTFSSGCYEDLNDAVKEVYEKFKDMSKVSKKKNSRRA